MRRSTALYTRASGKKFSRNSKVTQYSAHQFLTCRPHLAKFLISASLNIAPSNTNLSKWGKVVSSKCKLCDASVCTVARVLACCSISLKAYRFTWRHNSVLLAIAKFIRKFSSGLEVIADLPSRSYERPDSICTIPDDILPSDVRPDLSIIDRKNRRILLAELTIPFDTNLNARERDKADKYNRSLVPALCDLGWDVSFVIMGVGALGTIPASMKEALREIIQFCQPSNPPSSKDLHAATATMSKIGISTSYAIFRERERERPLYVAHSRACKSFCTLTVISHGLFGRTSDCL